MIAPARLTPMTQPRPMTHIVAEINPESTGINPESTGAVLVRIENKKLVQKTR